MKVLFALPPSSNPYIEELEHSIRLYDAEAEIGIHNFWDPKKAYDIIHIHWPEALLDWKEPTQTSLQKLEQKLLYWGQHSRIVVTRHNILPHNDHSSLYQDLYHLIYQYASAVVHMGQSSLDEFMKRYKQSDKLTKLKQKIIPHGLYTSYPNEITKAQARLSLGISKNRFVVLVFGRVRNRDEVKFALNTFQSIQIKNKLLLATQWCFSSNWWTNKAERFMNKYHPNYYLRTERVDNEHVQTYFNAADVVFIPRLNNLNSGNLILGFAFSKVVVGPDFGVVGEILRTTNNPYFETGNFKSASDALTIGANLAQTDQGEKNYYFAKKNWNWNLVGEMHFSLYKSLKEEQL